MDPRMPFTVLILRNFVGEIPVSLVEILEKDGMPMEGLGKRRMSIMKSGNSSIFSAVIIMIGPIRRRGRP